MSVISFSQCWKEEGRRREEEGQKGFDMRREVERGGSGCGAQLQGYSQNRRVHPRLVNKI